MPLPVNSDTLFSSAALGRQAAVLLDTEQPVPGVTTGVLRQELRAVGGINRGGGGSLSVDEDLEVTVNWGYAGRGGITMPGRGRAVERAYTHEELAAIGAGAVALGLTTEEALRHLGATTYDIHLNDVAYWRNIPARVWGYTIGGYQVIKKWLSYRERDLLGRSLTTDEVREVTAMSRRIAAIVLLEPALDANYQTVKGNCYTWPGPGTLTDPGTG